MVSKRPNVISIPYMIFFFIFVFILCILEQVSMRIEYFINLFSILISDWQVIKLSWIVLKFIYIIIIYIDNPLYDLWKNQIQTWKYAFSLMAQYSPKKRFSSNIFWVSFYCQCINRPKYDIIGLPVNIIISEEKIITKPLGMMM